MRSSNIWRFIEPTQLRLLDIAYVTVLLPLLLIIKAPMLVFMLLMLSLLLFRKKATTPTLLLATLAGLLAIFLSLYGAFNFAGLSRLKLFVELLIYLLILAVALQRLTRQVNFYLLISPALLLALSLFFFQNVGMLAYVVFEIFVLLWLILSYRMQAGIAESLRMTGMLFALSLPWVVLLFIFFPRISFEHASYGFRGEEIRRMGHDGTMHLDGEALLVPSERIVMEVGFQNEMPHESQLYFRGSVLYFDKKDHWEPLPRVLKTVRPPYQSRSDLVAYKVSLYPTHKKWLYLLDLPFEAPEGATIDNDFETTLEKPIEEPQHYAAGSALSYRYGADTPGPILSAALSFDRDANPRAREAAQRIRKGHPDPAERATAIAAFFRDRNLTYTLKPEALDLNNSTDSFLFEKRKGYCVHFASSFVTMARMAGLPARIVTGYKSDGSNSVKNYLAVKERDAHAWAEVLIDDHWQRVETTLTATQMDQQSLSEMRDDDPLEDRSETLMRLNLYLLYVKYQVETWIIEYSHFRQMQLLDRVRNDPVFVIKFIASLLLVIGLSIAAFFYFRRPVCREKALCALQPLLKALGKKGFVRAEGETLHRFFRRILDQHPDASALRDVDTFYQRIRYGSDRSDAALLRLKAAVAKAKRLKIQANLTS